MSDQNGCQVRGMVAAFAIGVAVGAGIALLCAPCSGKEARERLARRARDLKDRVGDAFEQAKDAVADKKAEIAAAVEAGKQAAREQRAKHTNPA